MSTFPYGPCVVWLADVKDVGLQFVRVVTDKQQIRHGRSLICVCSKDLTQLAENEFFLCP